MRILLLNIFKWLKNEIRGHLLFRGILVLIPFAYLFSVTKNYSWLQVSVVSMSSLIVKEKLQLTTLGVLLHGLSVIILFNLLFLTQFQPVLFIAICTLSAVTIIWITTYGDQLRTLGNWTFIPAIILSIELASEIKYSFWNEIQSIFPFLIISLLPTLVMSFYDQIRALKKGYHWQAFQLSYLSDFGKMESNLEAMLAMGLGIIIASSIVEYLPMQNGHWMIWGVASVITGNRETSPKKFKQRVMGVLLGVPLSILFAQYIIPSTPFNLTLITLCLLLTLVAFRRYIIAYTLRCFFVAIAAILITHSKTIAFERLSHVIEGGLIGLAAVFLLRFLLKVMKVKV
ncbi:FUSC family protein [Legionella sp. CNM-1927-20]|uniref:FUSC family protein n=1 Tax=Legionella sp. CNM-1927-20 TaxID=3422221 RepID=UPI00403AD5A7